ncbi:MAG: DEAD/DEAH box helicase family protein, partial [Nakamurella sp.]
MPTSRASGAKRATRRPRRTPARHRVASAALPNDPADGRLWFLAVPFQQQVDGAGWDPVRRAHTHLAPQLPPHLLPYRSQPYTVLRWREDQENGAPGPPPTPVAPMTPRPLQFDGAQAIVTAAAVEVHGAYPRGFLLTDDTGVGKTITAFLALREIARHRGLHRLLILVDRPKEITIPHWRRTITALGDGGLDILIASPDELPHLMKAGRPKWTWDLLAVDEAQLYRNADTARVKRFRAVSRFAAPHATAPFTLMMTATPAQHPAELTYLAPLLAQVHGEPTAAWTDFGPRLLAAGLPLRKGPYGKWMWAEHVATNPAGQQ